MVSDRLSPFLALRWVRDLGRYRKWFRLVQCGAVLRNFTENHKIQKSVDMMAGRHPVELVAITAALFIVLLVTVFSL